MHGFTIKRANAGGYYVEGGGAYREPVSINFAGSLDECLAYVKTQLQQLEPPPPPPLPSQSPAPSV